MLAIFKGEALDEILDGKCQKDFEVQVAKRETGDKIEEIEPVNIAV